MTAWGDRFNRMVGKTRFGVCRIFIQLSGEEVAPLLGILNQAAREAVESDGDLQVLGEGLVEICESLLRYDVYWQAAANEGDVFWKEEEAGDYVEELFTDSAQRYLSEPNFSQDPDDRDLQIPITRNVVVMLTVAFEGESPQLETDLADISALKKGLQALITLHSSNRLRAIQVHFSPAQLGDELTYDQMLQHFPELIPL